MGEKVFKTRAAGANGEQVLLDIEVSTPPSVIRVRRDAAEEVAEFAGHDLFDCMTGLREVLEAEGLLLCCQGARPDVHPTGMDRQMGDAWDAHVLSSEREEGEWVEIFAPAPLEAVGTLEEQRAFVIDFHGLRKK